MAVDVTPGPTFHAERPRVVMDQMFQSFDPAADGQRFLVVRPTAARSVDGQVVIVLNWLDELRRRVPLPE